MSEANATTSHEEIRKWAEDRGGRPSRVGGTGGKEDEGGILRFDFGKPEESLEEISWNEFFEIFDERELALLRQDENSEGKKNYFFKFVRRDSVKA